MKSFYSAKIWIKYRGFLFFLLFSLLPFFISFFLNIFLHLQHRLIATTVIYGCSFTLFLVLQSVRATHFIFLRKNDLPVLLHSLLIGVTAYLAALSVTFTVVTILTVIFGDSLPAWITASNQGFISFLDGDNAVIKTLWFFLITVAAPVIEEIIFRGYLQDSIAQLCHYKMTWLTTVVTSLIFAFFHTNSLSNMIFAFIVGLALSILRQRHGSLIPSMVAHGTVNAVSLLVGMLIR